MARSSQPESVQETPSTSTTTVKRWDPNSYTADQWANLRGSIAGIKPSSSEPNSFDDVYNYDRDKAAYQIAAQIASAYDEDEEGNDLKDPVNMKNLIDRIYVNNMNEGVDTYLDPAALRGEYDPANSFNMVIGGMKYGLDKFNEGIGRGIDWLGDTIPGGFIEATQGKEAADAWRNASDGTELAWIPSIAEDIGLSLIPGVGIPLVAGKTAIEESDNLYNGLYGVDPITLEDISPDDRAMDLGSAALNIGLSTIPGFGAAAKGMAKAGKVAGKELEKIGNVDKVLENSALAKQFVKQTPEFEEGVSKNIADKALKNFDSKQRTAFSFKNTTSAAEKQAAAEAAAESAARAQMAKAPNISAEQASNIVNQATDVANRVKMLQSVPEVSKNPVRNAINYAKYAKYAGPRNPVRSVKERAAVAKEGPSNALDRVLTFVRGEAPDDVAAASRITRRDSRKIAKQAEEQGKKAEDVRKELIEKRTADLERTGDNDNFAKAVKAAIARNRANKKTIGPTPFARPNIPAGIGMTGASMIDAAAELDTDPVTAAEMIGQTNPWTFLAVNYPGPKRALSKSIGSPGYYAARALAGNAAVKGGGDAAYTDDATQLAIQRLMNGENNG